MRALTIGIALACLVPCLVHAQRGTVTVPPSAIIDIPLNAQLCADTIFANGPTHGVLTLASPTGICTGTIVTPVEYLSLSAALQGATVDLAWRTAAERDCAGYEVQRSSDERMWHVVGFVRGQGTTTSESAYRHADPLPAPLLTAEAIHYRLRQIDFDGTATFSPTVTVHPGSVPVSPMLLALYPNPATDRLHVQFALPVEAEVRISVHAADGREVHAYRTMLHAAGGHVVPVDVGMLPPGAWFLALESGSTRLVQQFVIRR